MTDDALKLIADLDPRLAHLECDGFTRVAHHLLSRAGAPHRVMKGGVVVEEYYLPLHFWIELPDGRVLDYRLRMWAGENAPHGVFSPPVTVKYRGAEVEMQDDPRIIDILTGGLVKEAA